MELKEDFTFFFFFESSSKQATEYVTKNLSFPRQDCFKKAGFLSISP